MSIIRSKTLIELEGVGADGSRIPGGLVIGRWLGLEQFRSGRQKYTCFAFNNCLRAPASTCNHRTAGRHRFKRDNTKVLFLWENHSLRTRINSGIYNQKQVKKFDTRRLFFKSLALRPIAYNFQRLPIALNTLTARSNLLYGTRRPTIKK